MAIYVLLALFGIFLNLITVSNKARSLALLSFATIISIIRVDVGADYGSYRGLIFIGDSLGGDSHSEGSFYFIVDLANTISEFYSVYIVFAIYAILASFFIYKTIETLEFNNNFLYVYIYGSVFYLQSFNLIRLYVAVPLIWYAIVCKKRLNIVVTLILIAAFFHYSALLMLLIIPLLNRNYSNIIKLSFFVIILLLLIFIPESIIPNRYQIYLNNDYSYYSFNLIFFLLIGWFFVELSPFFKYKFLIKNLAFLSFVFPLLFIILGVQPDLIYRMSFYTMIYIPLYFSTSNSPTFFYDRLKFIFCRFIMPIIFIYGIFVNGSLNKIVPYQSYLY